MGNKTRTDSHLIRWTPLGFPLCLTPKFNLGGSSNMRRPSRSRSRPRHLLPCPPQHPPPRHMLENVQPSRPMVCREADCARRGELIAEDLEFVFMRGLWRLRFFCGRCGSCTLEACPSTSESEEQESQEQYIGLTIRELPKKLELQKHE